MQFRATAATVGRAKGRPKTERKAKENNGRGNTRRAQRRGECWPGAMLKIYERKTMNPARLPDIHRIRFYSRNYSAHLWQGIFGARAKRVKQGRKIPAALASNNCSRTQALKYSTEVTRKESPAAVKNDCSLLPFTQHINLKIPNVMERVSTITTTSCTLNSKRFYK